MQHCLCGWCDADKKHAGVWDLMPHVINDDAHKSTLIELNDDKLDPSENLSVARGTASLTPCCTREYTSLLSPPAPALLSRTGRLWLGAYHGAALQAAPAQRGAGMHAGPQQGMQELGQVICRHLLLHALVHVFHLQVHNGMVRTDCLAYRWPAVTNAHVRSPDRSLHHRITAGTSSSMSCPMRVT